MKKYIYIYNLTQANYYIISGITPVEIGTNKNTNKIYVKFIREETNYVYKKWCDKA